MANQMLKRFVLDDSGFFGTLLIDTDEDLGERVCEDCHEHVGIAIRVRLLYLQRGREYMLVNARHGRRIQEIIQQKGWAIRWLCVECYDSAVKKVHQGQNWSSG